MRKSRNLTRRYRIRSRKNKKKSGGHSSLKVAILFTGRIKGYENVKDNLKNIKDKYNATVFCSLNKSKKTEYVKGFCEFMDISDDRLNIEIPPKAPDFLRDPKMKVYHAYKEKVGNINANMRMDMMYSFFYNNDKAYTLVEKYQEANKMKFDIVLYYRADITAKEELILIHPVKDNTIYVPEVKEGVDCHEGYGCWCDYGGLCNQVFFGNPDTMKKALSLIDSLKHICIDQGVLFHAETLFKKHIDNNKISVERFPYFFSLDKARHAPNPLANEM